MTDNPELASLTIKDLRQLAGEHNIHNRSKLGKDELIEALRSVLSARAAAPADAPHARAAAAASAPAEEPDVLDPASVAHLAPAPAGRAAADDDQDDDADDDEPEVLDRDALGGLAGGQPGEGEPRRRRRRRRGRGRGRREGGEGGEAQAPADGVVADPAAPQDAAAPAGERPVRNGELRNDQGRDARPRDPRDDRPRGERRPDDLPRGERRPDDRPRDGGDRPRDDRPRGERRPDDRPREGGDRPRDDRPRDDRPRGDRRPDDRPRDGREGGDRPRDDRPRGERRPDDRPREGGDRPREGGDRPRDDRPRDPRADQRPPAAQGGGPRPRLEGPQRPVPSVLERLCTFSRGILELCDPSTPGWAQPRLSELLAEAGLVPLPTQGQPHPDFHQVVGTVPSRDVAPGHIAVVEAQGFGLRGDRGDLFPLRKAQVKVSESRRGERPAASTDAVRAEPSAGSTTEEGEVTDPADAVVFEVPSLKPVHVEIEGAERQQPARHDHERSHPEAPVEAPASESANGREHAPQADDGAEGGSPTGFPSRAGAAAAVPPVAERNEHSAGRGQPHPGRPARPEREPAAGRGGRQPVAEPGQAQPEGGRGERQPEGERGERQPERERGEARSGEANRHFNRVPPASMAHPLPLVSQDVDELAGRPKAEGFRALGLNDQVLADLAGIGYTQPTPIQQEAIPVALAGKDLIGQAQTGTGKTAAFVLPILQRLYALQGQGPVALVLCPTRELARQVHGEFVRMAGESGARGVVIYGGVSMDDQIDALGRHPHVVIGTPGRIIDHMRRRTLDLSRLSVAVLDEADQMLDIGFWPDVLWILGHTPPSRQNLLFSATMPEPIKVMAEKQMREPVYIKISPKQVTVEEVDQKFIAVERERKNELLAHFIETQKPEQLVVFCRTKHQTDRVAEVLKRKHYSAGAIHGDLPQAKRERMLQQFRNGELQSLIATNVAARGLDIPSVSHVVNYDIPENPEEYVHRIGRTARNGARGVARTFITPDDGQFLLEIEKHIGLLLEEEEIEGFSSNRNAPEIKRTIAEMPVGGTPRMLKPLIGGIRLGRRRR